MEQGTRTKGWFLPPAALMCPEEGHHSTDDRVALSAGNMGDNVAVSLPCVTGVSNTLQRATQPHILMVTKGLRPLWLSWTISPCAHPRCP